jgi:hypothetical protein
VEVFDSGRWREINGIIGQMVAAHLARRLVELEAAAAAVVKDHAERVAVYGAQEAQPHRAAVLASLLAALLPQPKGGG